MTSYLCVTCGTHYLPSATPPARCPICDDARQYVPPAGQQWIAWDALRDGSRANIFTQ